WVLNAFQELGLFSGFSLPPRDHYITIGRRQFAAICYSPCPLSRDNRCTGAKEWVKDDLAFTGIAVDEILYENHGFLCRMLSPSLWLMLSAEYTCPLVSQYIAFMLLLRPDKL